MFNWNEETSIRNFLSYDSMKTWKTLLCILKAELKKINFTYQVQSYMPQLLARRLFNYHFK